MRYILVWGLRNWSWAKVYFGSEERGELLLKITLRMDLDLGGWNGY